jgi:hypothetical protein
MNIKKFFFIIEGINVIINNCIPIGSTHTQISTKFLRPANICPQDLVNGNGNVARACALCGGLGHFLYLCGDETIVATYLARNVCDAPLRGACIGLLLLIENCHLI